MAISIEFKDKYVYFGPEAGLHTQGEARAEVYDVTGPRYHDGHDLSAMTWYVRASHPDYMTIINKQLRVSVAPGNEEQIIGCRFHRVCRTVGCAVCGQVLHG